MKIYTMAHSYNSAIKLTIVEVAIEESAWSSPVMVSTFIT